VATQPFSVLKSRLFIFCLWIGGLALALTFQRLQDAWTSEFGGHPDEAGHYVTGLFVRDAVAWAGNGLVSGFGEHGAVAGGKAFAEKYYKHYPKIGLGVWPPFFYLVQAAWTTVAGVSHESMMTLMAVLAGVLAALTGGFAAKEMDWKWGVRAAVILGVLPLMQMYSAMVMAEVLSGVLMLAAMLYLGKFLEAEKLRHALWFGLFAALAILTKGTGLALVFAAPLTIALSRKWGALRRPGLWMGVAIIGLVAGPWTWKTRALGHGGWIYPSPCWAFTSNALPYYANQLLVATGWLLMAAALIGLISLFKKPSARPAMWAALIALVPSAWAFQSIAPVGMEARHLLPTLPCMVLLAVRGAWWISSAWRFGSIAAFAMLVLFAFGPWMQPQGARHFASIGNQAALSPFRVVPKAIHGYSDVAERVMADAGNNRKLLVSGDVKGEGMMISEVAMRDEARPSWEVQRASKALGQSQWRGGEYRELFRDGAGLAEFLNKEKFGFIIVDDAISKDKWRPHHQLLHDALELLSSQSAVQLVKEFPLERSGREEQPLELWKLQ